MAVLNLFISSYETIHFEIILAMIQYALWNDYTILDTSYEELGEFEMGQYFPCT